MLDKLIEKNPEALEMDVITSKDDEGNWFTFVYYSPWIGKLDWEVFIEKSQFREYGIKRSEANVVCLN